MSRYDAEMNELREQKKRIEQRIEEIKKAINDKTGKNTWGNDAFGLKKRLLALYGNLSGVNEALCFLATYKTEEEIYDNGES